MIRCSAILLAAGVGSRMGSGSKKQFMELEGRPMMNCSLEILDGSPVIDDIVVVTGSEDVDYVRDTVIPGTGCTKVSSVISGGSERYLSVWEGLKYVRSSHEAGSYDKIYVFIHDAARPFLTEDIIMRCYEAVGRTGACVTGMPAQDTVRLSDEAGYGRETIPRDRVWLMQTPQVFDLELLFPAFEDMLNKRPEDRAGITDDVMVLQAHDPGAAVELVRGSYTNIKITTPDDLIIAAGIKRAREMH